VVDEGTRKEYVAGSNPADLWFGRVADQWGPPWIKKFCFFLPGFMNFRKRPSLQIISRPYKANRPYKSAICSNRLVGAVAKTVATNMLEPP